MKSYTHPAYSYTLIRQKDGSSYRKNWMYNRSTLILEGNHFKIWDAAQKIKSYKIFFININEKNLINKHNSADFSFWFKNLIKRYGNLFTTIILLYKTCPLY